MALQGDKKRGQRGGGKPPVDSKTRAKIRKLAREGLSQTKVAAATGVSRATVAKVCAAAKPPITFDRAKTAAAVEAHKIDLKARRVELTEMLLNDAFTLRQMAFDKREVTIMTEEMAEKGMEPVVFEVANGSADVKNLFTAVGIAVDKHLVLVKVDSDDRDLPAVEQWLLAMMGGAPQ